MCSRWDSLRSQLALSIDSDKSHRLFGALHARHPELVPFGDGLALVEFFYTKRYAADVLDEKDRIAGALVEAAADRTTSELAIELLLLGLWPGLTAAFGRLLRLFEKRPTELASEIASTFAVCVRRLDLRGCSRVASTLIRNTERVVRHNWTVDRSAAARVEELSPEANTVADPVADEAVNLAELRIWLSGVVPRDAELVVSIAVRGNDCHRAGAELGLNHECARKRFARAVRKIRQHLRETGVPDRGATTAFLGR